MNGFLKLNRSEATETLLGDPNAFALLALIAYRARREPGAVFQNGVQTMLETGQALIGDYRTSGLSEQQYRTAKEHLCKMSICRFRATNRGTVATLLNQEVWDINASEVTDKQRTSNGQATTNKKDKKERISFPGASEETTGAQDDCWTPAHPWVRGATLAITGTQEQYLGNYRAWIKQAPGDFWDSLKKDFPGVPDVEGEAVTGFRWLETCKKRRSNPYKFLRNWLTKAQQRATWRKGRNDV